MAEKRTARGGTKKWKYTLKTSERPAMQYGYTITEALCIRIGASPLSDSGKIAQDNTCINAQPTGNSLTDLEIVPHTSVSYATIV